MFRNLVNEWILIHKVWWYLFLPCGVLPQQFVFHTLIKALWFNHGNEVISWYFGIYNGMVFILCKYHVHKHIILCYDTALTSALHKWRHAAFLTDGVAATKTTVYESIKCTYLFETDNGCFLFVSDYYLRTLIKELSKHHPITVSQSVTGQTS